MQQRHLLQWAEKFQNGKGCNVPIAGPSVPIKNESFDVESDEDDKVDRTVFDLLSSSSFDELDDTKMCRLDKWLEDFFQRTV